MRTPPDIRKHILLLRDKERLTLTEICSRSRVSRAEMFAALGMNASENTLRKLDAFLDAPALHKRARAQTATAHEYEKLTREWWREFKYGTVHPRTFESWPYDKQRHYLNGATSKAKYLLQKKYLRLYGLVVKVPDGGTYWQFKTRCIHRLQGEAALRTGDRDSRRVPWPRPVLQEGS